MGSKSYPFSVDWQFAAGLALHAQIEDVLYNSGSFGVNDPMLGILRVFHIAVRDIDGQRNTSFTLCFLHGSDFAAGITGIKFVKPVFYSGKIVVNAIGISGIKTVIDGDKAYPVLRKGEVGV